MEENILIVHGGGPTAVINGSLYGAVTEARKYPQLQHIYAARNGTGGLLREELIDLTNVEEEKLKLLFRLREVPSAHQETNWKSRNMRRWQKS